MVSERRPTSRSRRRTYPSGILAMPIHRSPHSNGQNTPSWPLILLTCSARRRFGSFARGGLRCCCRFRNRCLWLRRRPAAPTANAYGIRSTYGQAARTAGESGTADEQKEPQRCRRHLRRPTTSRGECRLGGRVSWLQGRKPG
ncbi:hypothetical protein MRX96_017153 [Rhipicephalus microplus]